MTAANTLSSFVEEINADIDAALDKVIEQRDMADGLIQMSKQPQGLIERQREELRRRSKEIIDGLQQLRTKILRNQLSEQDCREMKSWLGVLGDALKSYLRFGS